MSKIRHSPREGSPRDAAVRGQRIEELFREELNSLLDSEVNDRALEGARVTLVELSRDGSRARIWFTFIHATTPFDATAIQAAFARASGFLRSRLCDALALKRMPELRFRHDPIKTLELDEKD